MENSTNKTKQQKGEEPDSKVRYSQQQRTIRNKHPIRRLAVFQIKLAVDALRDIVLSPVAFIASILDFLEKNNTGDSYFDKVMIFGRRSERRINLFEQNEGGRKSIDSLLSQFEEVVMKEYQDRELSKKTISAVEKVLRKDSALLKAKDKPKVKGE